YVDFDNYVFAYEAARKLISAGARKLCIILPPDRFTFAHHMRHGFMTAVREAGVPFEIAGDVTLDSKSEEIRLAMFRLLSETSPPHGFVCGGEVSALATMAAAYDKG